MRRGFVLPIGVGCGLSLACLSAACVPDDFTFGSAASVGGAGGGGGSASSFVTTSFSPQTCGNGELEPPEECDLGDDNAEGLFDQIARPAMLTPAARGCSPECEIVLDWHTQIESPGHTPVDMNSRSSDQVVLAWNAPRDAPSFKVAEFNPATGALVIGGQVLNTESFLAHSLVPSEGGVAILGTDLSDPMVPRTVLINSDNQVTAELPFAFDGTQFDQYGRTAELGYEPETDRRAAIGLVGGEATLVTIEFDLETLETFPSGLSGAAPGAIGSGNGLWKLGWANTIADFDEAPKFTVFDALPDEAIVRGICGLSANGTLVVGDIADGDATRGAIWSVDLDGRLHGIEELPAPSHIAAVDCRTDEIGSPEQLGAVVVVGDVGGIAMTASYDTRNLDLRWIRRHAGPGYRPASATAVGFSPDNSRVYVAGWHEDETGVRQPWIRRYIL